MSSNPELTTDIARSLQLAFTVTKIRRMTTLNHLYYTHQLLEAIRQMPQFTPSTKPLKLSEIVPEIKAETEGEEEEEKSEPFFAKVKKSINRIKRRA